MVLGSIFISWKLDKNESFTIHEYQIYSLIIGLGNYFLPGQAINEYLFPLSAPEEYGIFSELEPTFEASYSGNNPMMFQKSKLDKIKE